MLGSLVRAGAVFARRVSDVSGAAGRARPRQTLLDTTVALAKSRGGFGWQHLRTALDSSPCSARGASRSRGIRSAARWRPSPLKRRRGGFEEAKRYLGADKSPPHIAVPRRRRQPIGPEAWGEWLHEPAFSAGVPQGPLSICAILSPPVHDVFLTMGPTGPPEARDNRQKSRLVAAQPSSVAHVAPSHSGRRISAVLDGLVVLSDVRQQDGDVGRR